MQHTTSGSRSRLSNRQKGGSLFDFLFFLTCLWGFTEWLGVWDEVKLEEVGETFEERIDNARYCDEACQQERDLE